MKTTLISVASLLAAAALGQAATIALWTFEPPQRPMPTTNTLFSGLPPAQGNGSVSGFHAAPTIYFPQPGNGSANSLSASDWQIGDYWQFHVSTLGYSQIQFSWDQTTTVLGPTNFSLSFSTDGTTFTTVQSNIPVLTSGYGTSRPYWDGVTYSAAYQHFFNLSAYPALNNAPDVYLRLTSNLPAHSLDYEDNVLIAGAVVPEPATWALLGLGTAALLYRRRQA